MSSITRVIRMVFHRLNDPNSDADPEVEYVQDVESDLDCSVLTIRVESNDEVWDAEVLEDFVVNNVDPLNKGIMLRCDDTFMIELLEPKDGATIHDYWTDLRFTADPTYSELIGNEFIPNTKNGFRVLLVNPSMQVGPLGIASHLLRKANGGLLSVYIADDQNVEMTVEYATLSS